MKLKFFIKNLIFKILLFKKEIRSFSFHHNANNRSLLLIVFIDKLKENIFVSGFFLIYPRKSGKHLLKLEFYLLINKKASNKAIQ